MACSLDGKSYKVCTIVAQSVACSLHTKLCVVCAIHNWLHSQGRDGAEGCVAPAGRACLNCGIGSVGLWGCNWLKKQSNLHPWFSPAGQRLAVIPQNDPFHPQTLVLVLQIMRGED